MAEPPPQPSVRPISAVAAARAREEELSGTMRAGGRPRTGAGVETIRALRSVMAATGGQSNVASLMPSAVPTLDALAADPTCARGLPKEAIAALLAKCSAAQTALAMALLDREKGEASAPSSNGNGLLDPKQMAARLHVHDSWVRSEARAGRLPCIRLGKYIRFNLAEVEAALAESRNKPDH